MQTATRTSATVPTTQRSAAIVRPDPAIIEQMRGTARDPERIASMLRYAEAHFHLISPASSGSVPEGCEIVFSPIVIDVERETYEVPGTSKRALSKVALDRISAAAGVSWLPTESRRLDDGSDPYYCHFRAVGRYRRFDGSLVTVSDEKVVDLRDGSPQVEAMAAKSAAKAREKNPNLTWADSLRIGWQKTEGQVREQRLHILSMALTKARLRAIRSLGIRTAYELSELAKPFVATSVAFTGRTTDPELRRIFATATADAFVGARSTLYGLPSSTTSEPSPMASRPPPVGTSHDDDDAIDVPVEAPQAQEARQTPPQAHGREPGDEPAVRFGRAAGTPLCEASDDLLDWYVQALAKNVSDPSKSRWKDENTRELALARAEQGRRRGEDGRY